MVNIAKLTGAGNNFLLLDLRTWSKDKKRKLKRKKIARQYCNPNFSIGADGFIFLDSAGSGRLSWDFYNADGSNAEMCGNAARCVGRYITEHPGRIHSASFTLATRAGEVLITNPSTPPKHLHDIVPVTVEMPFAQDYRPDLSVRVGSKTYTFDYIDSGVPHAVISISKLGRDLNALIKNVDKLGDIVNKICLMPQFKQHGVNVTFYSQQTHDHIHSFTFERGVRGFTLACGTGAVAAAICHLEGHPGKVTVSVPGGILKVDTNMARPILKGPAQFIANIEFERI